MSSHTSLRPRFSGRDNAGSPPRTPARWGASAGSPPRTPARWGASAGSPPRTPARWGASGAARSRIREDTPLTFRDDDIAAEGSKGERGTAVAEGGANRSIARAAAADAGVALALAAYRERQLGPNRPAERRAGQLEAGRSRERETHGAGMRVDVVAPVSRQRT